MIREFYSLPIYIILIVGIFSVCRARYSRGVGQHSDLKDIQPTTGIHNATSRYQKSYTQARYNNLEVELLMD